MGFESECSALESVDDNEAIKPEKLANVEETVIENNGSCGVEHFDDKLLPDNEKMDSQVMDTVNLPSTMANTSPPPATIKGYGLKKWRRIRREVNKDGNNDVDNNTRILKRGLLNSGTAATKPVQLSAEVKQKSECSMSSTIAIVRSPDAAGDSFLMLGDFGLAVGPVFAAGAGTDPEDSEDRSSKSSTAASAPRRRYGTPAVVGFSCDKSKIKSMSGKNLGNSVLQGQHIKGQNETTKKLRGERVKSDKENSHSSMESDFQHSKFVSMQGTDSATSNGRQGRKPMNCDAENSDEAHAGEQQLDDRFQTGYRRKDAEEFEDVSNEERSENPVSLVDQDFLVESIISLRSAQDALEKEVQKLRDIGKDDIMISEDSIEPSNFNSVDPKLHNANPSNHVQNDSLESEVIRLKQNVNHLESRLHEATALLKLKEVKVVELETSLNSNKSTREGLTNTTVLQQNYKGTETDLEVLFRQKIEAEVVCLMISRAIHKLRIAVADQIGFWEEHKALASEQAQMLNKLGDAERKAGVLKRRANKLESSCEDFVETDEVLRLENKVCKYTSYLFLQIILLLIVLVLFVPQLSPQYAEVKPT